MAWKIALWIGRILATIIIACLLSIWTTSYVVTSYIQALLKQYDIPLEVEPVALGDMWGMISGNKPADQESLIGNADTEAGAGAEQKAGEAKAAGNTDEAAHGAAHSTAHLQQTDDSKTTDDDDPHSNPHSLETNTSVEGSTNNPEDGDKDKSKEEHLDDAFSQPAQEVLAPIEKGEQPMVTPDDIDASKDSLSAEDKERMFELMMNKLPPESWHMFSSYIEDGLTEQELLQVQQVMAQHLSKDEYEELMELLTAY